jgi:hypothetical protein
MDTRLNSILTTNLYPYQVLKWVNMDKINVDVEDSEVNQKLVDDNKV